MRVCPCWGVEYVLIVQSMSHMPGLPIQTEGFNLHKKAFILKRLVMFFFFVSFYRQFQYSATQISRHFHIRKPQINLTKFFYMF